MADVAKAKYHGIIDGKTSTTFDPYGTATRGHVSKMLYEVLTMPASGPMPMGMSLSTDQTVPTSQG
jgi:hypothetical protein